MSIFEFVSEVQLFEYFGLKIHNFYILNLFVKIDDFLKFFVK